MGHDKQFLAIRTDYITLNLFEGSLDCVHIEEDAHLLARLERITDNLLAIIADRSVQIGAINRVNTGNIRGSKMAFRSSLSAACIAETIMTVAIKTGNLFMC
jgi:Holliday junction resolvasome RuvABC endonuclease subunit